MTYTLKEIAVMFPEMKIEFHWTGQNIHGDHVYKGHVGIALVVCKDEGVITVFGEREQV